MAFVDRVRRWLRSWLPEARQGAAAAVPILRYATWVIAAIAFVLLAWLTWRVLRGASRARPPRGPGRPAAPIRSTRGRGRPAPAPPPRPETRARRSAAPTMRSCTASTKRAPGRSPRRARRASTCGCCRPADRRQPAVSFVARLFEGAWYGGAQPGIDDARQAVRHLRRVRMRRPGGSRDLVVVLVAAALMLLVAGATAVHRAARRRHRRARVQPVERRRRGQGRVPAAAPPRLRRAADVRSDGEPRRQSGHRRARADGAAAAAVGLSTSPR